MVIIAPFIIIIFIIIQWPDLSGHRMWVRSSPGGHSQAEQFHGAGIAPPKLATAGIAVVPVSSDGGE